MLLSFIAGWSLFLSLWCISSAQQIALGPCPQHSGLTPYQCDSDFCIDVPEPGVCHVSKDNSGFSACGCCMDEEISCDACGGQDIISGICKGIGPGEGQTIAYKGCPCTPGDKGGDPLDRINQLCPETKGEDTQLCTASACGGDSEFSGLCDERTYLGIGGKHVYCACCPDPAKTLSCDDCGGPNGTDICTGLPEYHGRRYRGCPCTSKPDADSDGGIVIIPIIPIIPFPIIPLFPIPPPGTPNPKKPCSTTTFPQCSECEGSEGWCQAGDNAGCPCREECDNNGDQPSCGDPTCDGNDEGKCSGGPYQDCECSKQCPEGEDTPYCNDSTCGGPVDDKADIGKCKGDEHSNAKDCSCIQESQQNFGPYIMSLSRTLEIQEAIKRIQAKPEESDSEPVKPTCTSAGITLPDGGLDTHDVLYKLRNALCSSECSVPEDLPGTMPATSAQNEGKNNCLLVARFEDTDIQAYMYRGSPPEGNLGQECFNSTQDIIEQCVQKDQSDYGWINGIDEGQFYQGGLGPLNGELPGNLSYTLPDPPNTKGTNLHINGDQCIVINDNKRCGKDDPYNIAYQDSDNSGATIYAKFDTGMKDTNKVTPGCKLDAKWPSSYGDIYFGEDNSLYDGSGNKINDQSCSNSPSNDEKVLNPYYAPRFNTIVAQIKLYKSGTCDGKESTLPVTMARINQDINLGDAYSSISLTLLNTDECTVKGCFAGYGCQDEEVKTTDLKVNECARPTEGPQASLNYDKLYLSCPNLDAISSYL